MGFTTFAGRVLLSVIFVLGGWLKFVDGETFLQVLEPKMGILRSHMASFGVPVPEIELKYLVTMSMIGEGLGGILLLFGSSLGAYLLFILTVAGTPMLYDFYNYDVASPEYAREFRNFLENYALAGALLFYVGMKNELAAIKSRKRKVKVKAV